MPKISTADIKNGLNILLDGNIYTIVEFQHVKPGKGGAFVRTRLKGLVNEKNFDKTFRSGETLDSVRVERHPYQFLYSDGDMFNFMHKQTYEQIAIPVSKVDGPEFLIEGEECEMVINAEDESILFCTPPQQITAEVTETDPGLKGDTAQGGTKPAKISSGATVIVPLFISVGDVIRVDTRSGQYIERAKTS